MIGQGLTNADLGVVLFVVACVVGLIWFARVVRRDVRGIKTTANACARIGRQTRLGLHERLGGDEIAQRAAERRR